MLGLVHAQTCRPLVAATVSPKADSRRGRVLVGSSRTRLPKALKLGSGVGAKKIFSVGTRAVAAGPPPTPTGRDKDDKKGKGDATLEVGDGAQRRVSSSGVPPGGSAGGAPPPSKVPPSTGIASSSPPSEVTEAFQRVQREAIESQTR